MFCADTSSWIAYFSGEAGEDIDLLDAYLIDQLIRMAPPVLAELLSDPAIPTAMETYLRELPVLDLLPGFWERAGKTRAELIKRKLKPKLADTLIAQVCIDHKTTLHSRDADFRPFAKYAGLRLVLHGLVH